MNKGLKDTDAIKVEDSTDLLLVLLYAPGPTGQQNEPIRGITRLQKLMFLLGQGQGAKAFVEEAKKLKYEPYKMGPYSVQLREELQALQAANLIVSERLEYVLPDDADDTGNTDGIDEDDVPSRRPGRARRVESFEYKLSAFGLRVAADLWHSLPKGQRDGLNKFKQFFNRLTLRQLLVFVYEKFPKFTGASTIKRGLGLG